MKGSIEAHTTSNLVVLSLFVAVIFILAITPLGFINLVLIKATIVHLPVIIGGVLLGARAGAILGFFFGVSSVIINSISPSLLSFAFSPLIPVPGFTRGSLWAVVISFVPRILTGVTPALLFNALSGLDDERATRKAAVLALSGAIGAFTNTALVMGLIYFVFKDAYAAARNIPVTEVLGIVLGVVGSNGLMEAVAAAVLTPVVVLPLVRFLRYRTNR